MWTLAYQRPAIRSAAWASVKVAELSNGLVLGAMGCREEPGPTSDRLDLVDDLVRKDPFAGDVRNSAANDWRAALTLETSQFLVGIYPA